MAPRLDLLLIAILLLAGGLRFRRLSEFPPGPFPDEASTVVDARCLLWNGADRHGRFLPIYLRAFGDYREGLFTYVAVPAVAGSSSPLWAVRAVAALAGLATVVLVYFLGTEWFGPAVGRWSAFFLAVDPQHVLWSRLGIEVVFVPLAGCATLLAMQSLRRDSKWGLVGVSAGLAWTMLAGMMGKPLAAMLGVVLLLEPRVLLRSMGPRPRTIVAGLILLVAAFPVLSGLFDGSAWARFEQIRAPADSAGSFVADAASRYLAYWSPTYLFDDRVGAPTLSTAGKMAPIGYACLWIGLASACWRRPAGWQSLVILVALTPIPASLTETLAPSRTLIGAPVLVIAMALGAVEVARWIRFRPIAIGLLLLAWFPNGSAILRDVTGPTSAALDRIGYGPTRRLVRQAVDEAPAYELVLIDTTVRFAPVYVAYFLDPSKREYQGVLERLERYPEARLALGSVLLAYPPMVANEQLAGSTLVLTYDGSLPDRRPLVVDGDLALYEWSLAR